MFHFQRVSRFGHGSRTKCHCSFSPRDAASLSVALLYCPNGKRSSTR